ncbi:hypothetical protein D3C72_1867090 [compost metagenome]
MDFIAGIFRKPKGRIAANGSLHGLFLTKTNGGFLHRTFVLKMLAFSKQIETKLFAKYGIRRAPFFRGKLVHHVI